MKFQFDSAFRVNEDLARQLLSLSPDPLSEGTVVADASDARPAPRWPVARLAELPLRSADAIVAHIEVNDRHGVGVLLGRLFGRYPDILSIRSQDHFGGEQVFGDLATRIRHASTSPGAVRRTVAEALGDNTVGRILCVPYFADDVRTTLALKDMFEVPLATYLMDDQNVCADGIPDRLMAELLERSHLRLAISVELATCYEAKYGHKLWLMPPVVPARLILDVPGNLDTGQRPIHGTMLGNIWGQQWLDLLRATVRRSEVRLRWYSTNHLRYLDGSATELAADGIEIPAAPPLPDAELVEELRRTAFVVVPTGTLDAADDRRFIAQLSLPSRIPFVLATSHAPFLVVGSDRTAAARFVTELGVGIVVPYDRDAFLAAARELADPQVNAGFRRRALALAGRFTDAGAAEWIWQSLARRQPLDQRYEDLMRKPRPEIQALVQAGRQRR